MDESTGKGQGDENPENKAAKPEPSEAGSGEHKLPVVWSPKFDAAVSSRTFEDESVHFVDADMPPYETAQAETAGEEAGATKASAAPTRSSRFVILAASVAIAAAVGSITGSLTASGIGGLMAASAEPSADTVEANSILKALKSELAELNAVKSSLDSSSHYANAQFAALSDRLARVEHAQTDPAQLAHIADTVDRLNKLNTAAPETTGSIATPAPGAPAAPTQAKAPIACSKTGCWRMCMATALWSQAVTAASFWSPPAAYCPASARLMRSNGRMASGSSLPRAA